MTAAAAFLTWQTITAGLIGLVAGLVIGFYVAFKCGYIFLEV